MFLDFMKILFKGPNNEAYGVEFERHGRRRVAYATKEIILSAGSLDSAKILMLSGIGPEEHLHSLGVSTHSKIVYTQCYAEYCCVHRSTHAL